MSQGTPSTLSDAIINGLNEFQMSFEDESHKAEFVNDLKLHIGDYIRNQLGTITILNENPEVQKQVDRFVKSLDARTKRLSLV